MELPSINNKRLEINKLCVSGPPLCVESLRGVTVGKKKWIYGKKFFVQKSREN